MQLKKTKRIIYAICWILPFILGTVGYCIENEHFVDALYESFTLYAINPVSDASNWMITLAKWGGPFVLASGILLALQGLVNRLRDYYISLHKEATAVYTDNEYGRMLASNLKYGILVTDDKFCDVKEHIIAFENDIDNMNFYQKHRDIFEGKNIYIQLNEIDSFLLRKNSIHFFNINEIIARKYWQEHNLLSILDKPSEVMKIAIIGFGYLGQNILNYGLLNNIYDLQQQIEYHVWGESSLYEHSLEKMKLMNMDKVIFNGADWKNDVQKLSKMDRIIVTNENCLELLQTLLYLCKGTEIYYYNPGDAVLEDIYKSEKLISFGYYGDILTEQNIKSDELYRAAKELNYKYACIYGNVSGNISKKEIEMNEQWDLLDGFTKGSNIAAADYHVVRKLILKSAKDENRELSPECLGKMEHIRWCRFHYLNHWEYGIPLSGKNKDAVQRIHVCLVPYEELKKEDQVKDYEAVTVLLDLMPVE